ncbi:hypothetical protein [Kineococcus aurantiacus]|uniref:Uncharacterized protein n=1 Tax=Kineococcus aurantiacus TaxID=37633 RepID=A0A7Y9J2V4_9ACTN|nr:hypothetical protein [Kineococcus aurantiacus]NYD24564.1 hypothetical protein [Kineococcus aurantiacus]
MSTASAAPDDAVPPTLVDLPGVQDGTDVEFEPVPLGLTARTPDLRGAPHPEPGDDALG